MNDLIENNSTNKIESGTICKPNLTQDLEKWLEYNEISSATLRQSN